MHSPGSPYPSFYGKTPSSSSNRVDSKYKRTPRNESPFKPTRFTVQAKHSYRTTASSSPSSSEKLSLTNIQDDSRYLEHLLYIKDSIEKSDSSRSRTGSPSTDRSIYTLSPPPKLGIKDCLEFCLTKKVGNTSISQILEMDPTHFQAQNSGPKALARMLNEFGKNMYELQKNGAVLGKTLEEIKGFQEILEDIYAIIKAFKVLNPDIQAFQPHREIATDLFSTPRNRTPGTLSDAQKVFRQHFKKDVGDIFNLEKSGYKGSKGLSLSVSRDKHEVKDKNAWTNFTNELVGKNIKNLFQKDPEQFMAIMHSNDSLAANHVQAPDDGEEIVMKFKNRQEATNFFNHLEKMCDDENIRLQDKSVTITQLWIKKAFERSQPQTKPQSPSTYPSISIIRPIPIRPPAITQHRNTVSVTSSILEKEKPDTSSIEIQTDVLPITPAKTPVTTTDESTDTSDLKDLEAARIAEQVSQLDTMISNANDIPDISDSHLGELHTLLFNSDKKLNDDNQAHSRFKTLTSRTAPMGFIALLRSKLMSGDGVTEEGTLLKQLLVTAEPLPETSKSKVNKTIQELLLGLNSLALLTEKDITPETAMHYLERIESTIDDLLTLKEEKLTTLEYVARTHTAPKLKKLIQEIKQHNKEKQRLITDLNEAKKKLQQGTSLDEETELPHYSPVPPTTKQPVHFYDLDSEVDGSISSIPSTSNTAMDSFSLRLSTLLSPAPSIDLTPEPTPSTDYDKDSVAEKIANRYRTKRQQFISNTNTKEFEKLTSKLLKKQSYWTPPQDQLNSLETLLSPFPTNHDLEPRIFELGVFTAVATKSTYPGLFITRDELNTLSNTLLSIARACGGHLSEAQLKDIQTLKQELKAHYKKFNTTLTSLNTTNNDALSITTSIETLKYERLLAIANHLMSNSSTITPFEFYLQKDKDMHSLSLTQAPENLALSLQTLPPDIASTQDTEEILYELKYSENIQTKQAWLYHLEERCMLANDDKDTLTQLAADLPLEDLNICFSTTPLTPERRAFWATIFALMPSEQLTHSAVITLINAHRYSSDKSGDLQLSKLSFVNEGTETNDISSILKDISRYHNSTIGQHALQYQHVKLQCDQLHRINDKETISDVDGFKALSLLVTSPGAFSEHIAISYLSDGAAETSRTDLITSITKASTVDLAMRDILSARKTGPLIAQTHTDTLADFFTEENIDTKELKNVLLLYEEETQGGFTQLLESMLSNGSYKESKFFKLAASLVSEMLGSIRTKLQHSDSTLLLGELYLLNQCLKNGLLKKYIDENELDQIIQQLDRQRLILNGDPKGTQLIGEIYTTIAEFSLIALKQEYKDNSTNSKYLGHYLTSYLRHATTIREHFLISPDQKSRFDQLQIKAINTFNQITSDGPITLDLKGFTEKSYKVTLVNGSLFRDKGINLLTGEQISMAEDEESYAIISLPDGLNYSYQQLQSKFPHIPLPESPRLIPVLDRTGKHTYQYKLDQPGDVYLDFSQDPPKILKKHAGEFLQAVSTDPDDSSLCKELSERLTLSTWQTIDSPTKTYLIGLKGKEYEIKNGIYTKLGPPKEIVSRPDNSQNFLHHTDTLHFSSGAYQSLHVYGSTAQTTPDHIFTYDSFSSNKKTISTLTDKDHYRLISTDSCKELCTHYGLNPENIGVFEHPDTGHHRYYITIDGKVHIFDKTVSIDGRDTLCPTTLEGLAALCSLNDVHPTLISDAIMLFRDRYGVKPLALADGLDFGTVDVYVKEIVFGQTQDIHNTQRHMNQTQAGFTLYIKQTDLSPDEIIELRSSPLTNHYLSHAIEKGDITEETAKSITKSYRPEPDFKLTNPVNRILLGQQLKDIETRFVNTLFDTRDPDLSFPSGDYLKRIDAHLEECQTSYLDAERRLQDLCTELGLVSSNSREYVVRTLIQGDPDGHLSHLDDDKLQQLTTQCFFYLLQKTEYTHTQNLKDKYIAYFCTIKPQVKLGGAQAKPLITHKQSFSDTDIDDYTLLAKQKRAYHPQLSRFSSLSEDERFKLLLYLDREAHIEGGHRLKQYQYDIIESALEGRQHIFEAGTGSGKTSVMNMYYAIFYGMNFQGQKKSEAPPHREKPVVLVVPSALQLQAITDLNHAFNGFKMHASAWNFDPTLIDKTDLTSSLDYAERKLQELLDHSPAPTKGRHTPHCLVVNEQVMSSINNSITEIRSILYSNSAEKNAEALQLLQMLKDIKALATGDVFDEMHATTTDKQRQRNSKGKPEYRDIDINHYMQNAYKFITTSPLLDRYVKVGMNGQLAEEEYNLGLEALTKTLTIKPPSSLFSEEERTKIQTAMGENTNFFTWLQTTSIKEDTISHDPELSKKCAVYKKLFFTTLVSASKLKYGADYKAREKEDTAQSFATPTKAANEDSEENVKFNDPYLTTWLTISMMNRWHLETQNRRPLHELVRPNFIRNFGQQLRSLPFERLTSEVRHLEDPSSTPPHMPLILNYLAGAMRKLSPSELNELALAAHSRLSDTAHPPSFMALALSASPKEVLSHCSSQEINALYADVVRYFFATPTTSTQLAFIMSDTKEFSEATQSNNALNAMMDCFEATAERRPYRAIAHSGTTPSDELTNVVQGQVKAYTVEGIRQDGTPVTVPLALQKQIECSRGTHISEYEGHNDVEKTESVIDQFAENFNNGCRILVDTGKVMLEGDNRQNAEKLIVKLRQKLPPTQASRAHKSTPPLSPSDRIKTFYYDPNKGWMVLFYDADKKAFQSISKHAYIKKESDIVIQYFSHREATGQDLKAFQTPDMGIMLTVDQDTDRDTFLQGFGRGRHQKMESESIKTETGTETITMPVSSHSLFYCCSQKVVADIKANNSSEKITHQDIHDHIVLRKDAQDTYNAIKSQTKDLMTAYKQTICSLYDTATDLTPEQQKDLHAMTNAALEHKIFDGSDLFESDQRIVTIEDIQKMHASFIQEVIRLNRVFGTFSNGKNAELAKKVSRVTRTVIGEPDRKEIPFPQRNLTDAPYIDQLYSRAHSIQQAINDNKIIDFGSTTISDHDTTQETALALGQEQAQQQEQAQAQENSTSLAKQQEKDLALDQLPIKAAKDVLPIHNGTLNPVSYVNRISIYTGNSTTSQRKPIHKFLSDRLNVNFDGSSRNQDKLTIQISDRLMEAASNDAIPRLSHYIIVGKKITFVDPKEFSSRISEKPSVMAPISALLYSSDHRVVALAWTLLATQPFLMTKSEFEGLKAYKQGLFQKHWMKTENQLRTALETAVGLERDVIQTFIHTKVKGRSIPGLNSTGVTTYGIQQDPTLALSILPTKARTKPGNEVNNARKNVVDRAGKLKSSMSVNAQLISKYKSQQNVEKALKITKAYKQALEDRDSISKEINRLIDITKQPAYELLEHIFKTADDKTKNTILGLNEGKLLLVVGYLNDAILYNSSLYTTINPRTDQDVATRIANWLRGKTIELPKTVKGKEIQEEGSIFNDDQLISKFISKEKLDKKPEKDLETLISNTLKSSVVEDATKTSLIPLKQKKIRFFLTHFPKVLGCEMRCTKSAFTEYIQTKHTTNDNYKKENLTALAKNLSLLSEQLAKLQELNTKKDGIVKLHSKDKLTDEEFETLNESDASLSNEDKQSYVNYCLATNTNIPETVHTSQIISLMEGKGLLRGKFMTIDQSVIDSAKQCYTFLNQPGGIVKLSATAAIDYSGPLKENINSILTFLQNPYIANLMRMMDYKNFLTFIRDQQGASKLSFEEDSPLLFIITRIYQHYSGGSSQAPDLNDILNKYFIELYSKGVATNSILSPNLEYYSSLFNVDMTRNPDGVCSKGQIEAKIAKLTLAPPSDASTAHAQQQSQSSTRDRSKSPTSTAYSVSSPRSSHEASSIDSKETDVTPRSSYNQKDKEPKQIQSSKDTVPSKRTHTSITPSSSPKTMSQQLKHKTPLTREEQKSPNAKILSPYLPPTSNRTQPTSSNSRTSNASPLKQRQKKGFR